MQNNAFFKTTDPTISMLDGYTFPAGWWSRPYEYAWAIQFAAPGQIVADMGCGYTYRPFKGALAEIVHWVYAVDGSPLLLNLACKQNMQFVVGDFTAPLAEIAPGSLDRAFCISVLEDVGRWVGQALRQFAQAIKPDGRIILTMDVPYDPDKPLGQYPGVNLDVFMRDVAMAGLVFEGAVDLDKTGVIFHEAFNLTCFHCILRHE